MSDGLFGSGVQVNLAEICVFVVFMANLSGRTKVIDTERNFLIGSWSGFWSSGNTLLTLQSYLSPTLGTWRNPSRSNESFVQTEILFRQNVLHTKMFFSSQPPRPIGSFWFCQNRFVILKNEFKFSQFAQTSPPNRPWNVLFPIRISIGDVTKAGVEKGWHGRAAFKIIIWRK